MSCLSHISISFKVKPWFSAVLNGPAKFSALLKSVFYIMYLILHTKTTFMSTYIMYESSWKMDEQHIILLYVLRQFLFTHRTSSPFNFNNLFLLIKPFTGNLLLHKLLKIPFCGGQGKYNVDYYYYLHNNVWEKHIVKFIFEEPWEIWS